SEFSRWGGDITGAQVLELGCGAGIDSLLFALQPVRRVVGIDLHLPLFESGDGERQRGERARRLTRQVLRELNLEEPIEELLERLPVQFEVMDATRMPYPDGSFDFLFSRAAMEHILPIDKALAEMARVVRFGGLIHHSIDPYFWVRGCHRSGLVDIPWAHARL